MPDEPKMTLFLGLKKKCSKQGFNLFSNFFWGLCGVWSWAGMLMGEVHVNVGFGLNEK
jgi:hypothetical protein